MAIYLVIAKQFFVSRYFVLAREAKNKRIRRFQIRQNKKGKEVNKSKEASC